jgi:hypothetical protein
MVMKRLWILALATLACNLSGRPATPAAAPTIDPPTPLPPTATAEPTPSSTEIPVGPPDFWSSYTSSADSVWVLDPAGPFQRELPFRLGQYYDFAPTQDTLLYATHFADRGAGPGNLAVSDLYTLHLASGVTRALVRDDVVVEALWMPNGEDVVYILATDSTYEMRLRTSAGEDQLLATDVAFTFRPSPTGRYIAFTRESRYETPGVPGLYVTDIETGVETKISEVDKAGTGGIEDQPIWSWDERYVLLIHFGGTGSAPVLASVDGSISGAVTFADPLTIEPWYDAMFYSPLWEPDNRHVIAMVGVVASDEPIMGGPSYLVRLELDPSATGVVAGQTVGEALQILGWQQPGRSLWILSADSGEPTMITLPSEG